MDYLTLRALATEWDAALAGAVVVEAYTQQRGELSLALDAPGGPWTLHALCEPGRPLLWRSEGHGRARRNTAEVLPDLKGRRVTAVRIAERDRFVFLRLEEGAVLQLQPFGPRPNAFLVEAGVVRAAFLHDGDWAGRPAPVPQPAPGAETQEAFLARWQGKKTVAQALAAALPVLGRTLAAQAARGSGLDPGAPAATLDAPALGRLFEAARGLERDALDRPAPRIYWRGRVPEALSLVALTDLPAGWQEERFASVDEAVRVWAQRTLGLARFLGRYRPLDAALAAAAARLARRADGMAEELAKPSRADRYEWHAHLLMAQAAGEGPGSERATLPDLMGDGSPVEIPMDPALSAVENAQRLYARARQTRQARAHAESRWSDVLAAAERAASLHQRLHALDRLDALERFLTDEKDALAGVLRPEAVGEEALPYRRFVLPGGWEARVGKNARANAELTTRHAGPHDLWLHARGVAGSHVVLRRPSKTAVPDRKVVEAAAALAAYFSQAKTQALVPVTVTERKHVRPVKGGAPGLVRVDREDVLIVEPRLPDAAAG